MNADRRQELRRYTGSLNSELLYGPDLAWLLDAADERDALRPVAQAAVAFTGCESHADVDAIADAVAALPESAVAGLRVSVERLGELRAGLALRHEREREQYGDLADCTREVLMADVASARVERDRLAVENAALREAASAPAVHLAAGQMAVWPWATLNGGGVAHHQAACARRLHGDVASIHLQVSLPSWHVFYGNDPGAVARGTAPDIESAKAAALAAVVRLAKGVDAAPAAKEAR